MSSLDHMNSSEIQSVSHATLHGEVRVGEHVRPARLLPRVDVVAEAPVFADRDRDVVGVFADAGEDVRE